MKKFLKSKNKKPNLKNIVGKGDFCYDSKNHRICPYCKPIKWKYQDEIITRRKCMYLRKKDVDLDYGVKICGINYDYE